QAVRAHHEGDVHLAGDGARGQPADPAVRVHQVGPPGPPPAGAQALGEVPDVVQQLGLLQRTGRTGVDQLHRRTGGQPAAGTGRRIVAARVDGDVVTRNVVGGRAGERPGQFPGVDRLDVLAVEVGGGHKGDVQRTLHDENLRVQHRRN